MKITLKATRYFEANGEVQYCLGQITAGKEVVGERQGWSGDWTVKNFKTGMTKHFTTEKAIREWFAQEPKQEAKTDEESLKEYVAKHGKSFLLAK